MKSRLAFGLLVVMIALALAPSSFAQVQIQIFNSASPQEIKTNRTAETSDPASAGSGITVSGSLLANSALTQTDLILTFPAPITTSPTSFLTPAPGNINVPIGDGIRIVAATGVFTNATIKTVVGSTMTIQLIASNFGSGAPNPDNQNSGSFRIISTRIDANSLAGAGPFNTTASLSNSANNFLLRFRHLQKALKLSITQIAKVGEAFSWLLQVHAVEARRKRAEAEARVRSV
jgi:hypothetical protein